MDATDNVHRPPGPGDPSANGAAPAETRERAPSGSWALVVSHDEVLRGCASSGLRQVGFSCDDAPTGLEALEKIERLQRAYSLVVVDLELPDIPAAEIAAIVRMMMPSAVLVRCGAGVAPRKEGGDAWLAKPALASEFTRLVAFPRPTV